MLHSQPLDKTTIKIYAAGVFKGNIHLYHVGGLVLPRKAKVKNLLLFHNVQVNETTDFMSQRRTLQFIYKIKSVYFKL